LGYPGSSSGRRGVPVQGLVGAGLSSLAAGVGPAAGPREAHLGEVGPEVPDARKCGRNQTMGRGLSSQ